VTLELTAATLSELGTVTAMPAACARRNSRQLGPARRGAGLKGAIIRGLSRL